MPDHSEPTPIPVREVWPHENDFTRWLAENMDLLSKAVCLELELVQKETPLPGNLRVDIFARTVGTGDHVVIENQMEDSDNDHLAGLLHYASHSDSRILILVAGSITHWYRRTIEWLNDSGGFQIYGVEMSAWRNGAEMERRLEMVAGPSLRTEWKRWEYPAIKRKYLDFFGPLVTQLWNEGIAGHNVAEPIKDHDFPSGIAGITYHAGFWGGGYNPVFSIYLWISTDSKEHNKAIFDAIHDRFGPAIQSELPTLWWDRRDTERMSALGISIPGSIEDPEANLDEIRDWAARHVPKFKAVVQPHLEQVANELLFKPAQETP